jgi:hypothetical protein
MFEEMRKEKMDKDIQREAIEKILPIVQSLKSYEWSRLVSIINSHYTSKAAKLTLDGNDINFLEKNLKRELLR